MDKCPVCNKKILQHSKHISCCICCYVFHRKCLPLSNEELVSVEDNRTEWFCEICLANSLPFNHIVDDSDFIAALFELSSTTAESLRYLSDKIFHPFEVNEHDHQVFGDIDPDVNFINSISLYQNSCNYHLETSFNELLDNHNIRFSLCHLNIRSIKQNVTKFETFLEMLNLEFTIIGLTETWLHDHDCNLYSLSGYHIAENHRESRNGGGVAVCIKDCISFTKRCDLSVFNCDIESVFVEIDKDQVGSSKNIVIGTIYRPPGNDMGVFNTEVNNLLDSLNKENKLLYIMGDFNINLLNSDSHHPTGEFLEIMYINMLFPLITRPTRVTANSATLIDNIFTNNYCSNDWSAQGIFVTDISDHYPVFHISGQSFTYVSDEYFTTRVYNNINKQEFCTAMAEMDWQDVLDLSDTQDAFTNLHNILIQMNNKYFPKVKIKKGYSNRKPWLTEALRNSIKIKNKLYYVYKKTQSVKNELAYKNYKTTLSKLMTRAEKQHYHDLLIKHKYNIRKSWSVIKKIIQKNKKSLCQTKFQLPDGTITDDKGLISAKFNDFFVNIGPTLANKIVKIDKSPLSFMDNGVTDTIFLSPVTSTEMNKLIMSLKDSAPGWDDITTSLLKMSIEYLRDPLCYLCNRSLQEGIFPSQLKIADVLPLFKAEDPLQFNNYRPVSLLCILTKVFEKIMYSRLHEFLEKLDILYEYQFGFRKKHSTHLAHLILHDKLSKVLDDGKTAIGIYLDFSKAFDTVDHDILLSKLFYYGIRGPAYDWFQSYLSDRSQYVTYNGVKSSTKPIKCGVPQGSILGPLLFLIYINDLPNVCKVTMPFLFADDTHLFTSGDDLDDMYDTANHELNNIAEWLKVNKLSLNVKKTHYMVFSGINSSRSTATRTKNLKIYGEEISEVSKTKFLGVIIDNKLKWQHHIAYIS